MKLAVNIDHIATLRNARQASEPDPVTAAHLAELAGAVGIVCHLREDRRHIKDRDLELLRQTVKTKLDLEMAMTPEMKDIAIKTKPDLVTLVPEKRQELTTEGGLDVMGYKHELRSFIADLKSHGIPTSLFVEPTTEAITVSAELGADVVELHTGKYSLLKTPVEIGAELERLQSAAHLAKTFDLHVVAGHGLNYINAGLLKSIPELEEVSIGHALIARAALYGMEKAVKDMINLIS
jgi:pyridoxine 5-phosphate synthase